MNTPRALFVVTVIAAALCACTLPGEVRTVGDASDVVRSDDPGIDAVGDTVAPDTQPTGDTEDDGPDVVAPTDVVAEAGCSFGRMFCSGSCVDTMSDLVHCGACDRPCGPANATGVCRDGVCAIGACGTGFGDCNTTAGDGCETPLNSVGNCGMCGTTCTMGQVCSGGTCTSTCGGATPVMCGMACTNTMTDARNCGTCGNVCPTPPNGAAACFAGTCGVGLCTPGFANCNSIASDGCETPLNTAANCGVCGRSCMGGATCQAGVCACPAGQTMCSGICRALASDTANCGMCGRVCPSAPNTTSVTCAAGTCGFTCTAGWGNCDSNPANGCETSLFRNRTNCGACGTVCAPATHDRVCDGAGFCMLCPVQMADCNLTNTCDVMLGTATDCRICGQVCSGATPTCTGSGCM